jgi:hypothetical protein
MIECSDFGCGFSSVAGRFGIWADRFDCRADDGGFTRWHVGADVGLYVRAGGELKWTELPRVESEC